MSDEGQTLVASSNIEALRRALAQQRKYEVANWPFVGEDNKPTGTGVSITYHLVSLWCASPEHVLSLPAQERDERLREIWKSFTLAGSIIKRYEDATVALLAESEGQSGKQSQIRTERQAQRLAFVEKRVQELADELAVYHLTAQHSQPQAFVLDAAPKPEQHYQPPRPDKFLSEHVRKLIDMYPGMLFYAGVLGWYVGLTLDKERIVFVPETLYWAYERECLQAVGWTPEHEAAWYESIEVENDEGEVETPDWPNPLRRKGVWKARQVAHWTNEEESAPEVECGAWPNGTAG